MAYRSRRTARRPARSRAPARSGTRRTYAAKRGGRVSRSSAGRPQTVRIVLEQAPPSVVARGPINDAGIMQVPAGKPQKAKF